MAKYKITVVKRMANQDLIDQYGKGIVAPCDRFTDGQEFILDSSNKPDGFCSWAWADIQRDATIIRFGGNIPYVKQPGTHIVCCTDAFRPVAFKIERLD